MVPRPGGVGLGADVVASGAFEAWKPLAEGVIRENDEKRPELSSEPWRDPLHQVVDLGRGEVCWKNANGFNEVINLQSTISGVGGRGDLEQGPGSEADHLNLAAWVRLTVAFSEHLEDLDPDLRLGGHSIPDGVLLELLWPLIFTPKEEGAKLRPDGAGVGNGGHANVVGNGSVLVALSGVVDHNDVHLLAHQGHQNGLNMLLGKLLPLLANDLGWNAGRSLNHEAVLVSLILAKICHLRVNGDLVLNHTVEATVVLLYGEDAVFQQAAGLNLPKDDFLRRERKAGQGILGAIEQMEKELESGKSGEVNSVGLIVWNGVARQQHQVNGLGVSHHR